MIQPRENKYYYDPLYDTLTIYLDKETNFYAEEEFSGIYIMYSEKNDVVVGAEILYFKSRNSKLLSERLPKEIMSIVNNVDTNYSKGEYECFM